MRAVLGFVVWGLLACGDPGGSGAEGGEGGAPPAEGGGGEPLDPSRERCEVACANQATCDRLDATCLQGCLRAAGEWVGCFECLADASTCAEVNGPCAAACDPPGCRTDADCHASQRCRNGSCLLPSCARDADCASSGMICVDEFCAFRTCEGNGDCPDPGTICRQSLCVPGCEVDEDCARGQLCVNAWCRERQCATDQDCPYGQRCHGWFCAPPGRP